MKIILWPDFQEWSIEAVVFGDVITINGEPFDFTPLKEGQRLPGRAVKSEFFFEDGHIERINGEIRLTLRFPVEWDSPVEVRSPVIPTVLFVNSGNVPFPDTTTLVVEEPVYIAPELPAPEAIPEEHLEPEYVEPVMGTVEGIPPEVIEEVVND